MHERKINMVTRGTVQGVTIGNIYRLPRGRFEFKVLQIEIHYDHKEGILDKRVWLQAYDTNLICSNLKFLSPFTTTINNPLFYENNLIYNGETGELKYNDTNNKK